MGRYDETPTVVEHHEDTRQPFEEPTLTYVKPEVKELGNVVNVTTAFFGSFSP